MKNKSISRNVKRRLTFFGPLISIILIFCITSICSYGYNIYSLKKEEQNLKNKLSSLQEEADNLNDEITKLKDPNYIAKYARENYYYTKNGEYVIKINESDEDKDVEVINDTNKAYYVISLVVLLLIVLLVILRHKKKKDNEN